MNNIGKYVWTAILVAIAVHVVGIYALPRLLMNTAIERIGNGHYNAWRASERVTPISRSIPRPSPDFAYSACPYDLSQGPITIRVAPWSADWSLSLYADNSDNFYVVDDREARSGADITLVRTDQAHPDDAQTVVESPSARGIALVRRLAPTLETFNAAGQVAHGDACAPFMPPA